MSAAQRIPRRDDLAALAQTAERAARLFPPATLVGGQYVLRGVLGNGGMGIVFVAWDQELERECALKILLPHQHPRYAQRKQSDAAAMLVDEAKTHAKLAERSADFFIQIFRRGHFPFLVDEGGTVPHEIPLPYYSMERLKGVDFLRMIQRFRRNARSIPINEVLNLAHQAATGLGIAHELGIVHRDIKPNNLYVHEPPLRAPTVKTLDFGISTRHGERTRVGTGTSRYASPELLAGDQVEESVQSDIYPFGLALYELCALRGPFDTVEPREQNAFYWNHVHRYQSPPSLAIHRPDAPRALIEVIDAALEKLPANRPKASDMAAAFAAMLAERVEERTKGAALSELLRSVRVDDGHAAAASKSSSASAHGTAPLPSSGSLTGPATSHVFIRKDSDTGERQRGTSTAPSSEAAPLDLAAVATTEPSARPPDATAPLAIRTLEGLGRSPQATPPMRVFASTSEIFDSVWTDDTRYFSSPLQGGEPETDEPIAASVSAIASSRDDAGTAQAREPAIVPSSGERIDAVRRARRRYALRAAASAVAIAGVAAVLVIAIRTSPQSAPSVAPEVAVIVTSPNSAPNPRLDPVPPSSSRGVVQMVAEPQGAGATDLLAREAKDSSGAIPSSSAEGASQSPAVASPAVAPKTHAPPVAAPRGSGADAGRDLGLESF